jgi:hypothetical protein
MGKKKKTQIVFHQMMLKVKMGNSKFPSIKKNPRQEEMCVKIKEIRNRDIPIHAIQPEINLSCLGYFWCMDKVAMHCQELNCF